MKKCKFDPFKDPKQVLKTWFKTTKVPINQLAAQQLNALLNTTYALKKKLLKSKRLSSFWHVFTSRTPFGVVSCAKSLVDV